MAVSAEAVLEQLKNIIDPELMVSIVDLGLIYDIRIDEVDGTSNVEIDMTMTSPACPAGPYMVEGMTTAVKELDEVGDVEINVVFDPPWTPDRMTEEARDELGMF